MTGDSERLWADGRGAHRPVSSKPSQRPASAERPAASPSIVAAAATAGGELAVTGRNAPYLAAAGRSGLRSLRAWRRGVPAPWAFPTGRACGTSCMEPAPGQGVGGGFRSAPLSRGTDRSNTGPTAFSNVPMVAHRGCVPDAARPAVLKGCHCLRTPSGTVPTPPQCGDRRDVGAPPNRTPLPAATLIFRCSRTRRRTRPRAECPLVRLERCIARHVARHVAPGGVHVEQCRVCEAGPLRRSSWDATTGCSPRQFHVKHRDPRAWECSHPVDIALRDASAVDQAETRHLL